MLEREKHLQVHTAAIDLYPVAASVDAGEKSVEFGSWYIKQIELIGYTSLVRLWILNHEAVFVVQLVSIRMDAMAQFLLLRFGLRRKENELKLTGAILNFFPLLELQRCAGVQASIFNQDVGSLHDETLGFSDLISFSSRNVCAI